MLQQETGEVMESEEGSVEFETPTDDEEVTIPSQNKYKKVPDIPNSDIRDEQTLSNTQREDWLLPTEPMHGARPRHTDRERPPVIDNPALRDAAGNTAVRNPSRTFLLSPGRADFDRRGGIYTAEGGGGHPAPEPQGVRAVPKPFPDSLQEGDQCQKNIGSPVDMLVDTVSRIMRTSWGHSRLRVSSAKAYSVRTVEHPEETSGGSSPDCSTARETSSNIVLRGGTVDTVPPPGSRGWAWILIRERRTRPPGSAVVFRQPAVRCPPRWYHHTSDRRLFCSASWL